VGLEELPMVRKTSFVGAAISKYSFLPQIPRTRRHAIIDLMKAL
jgi:hypothetical protein